MSEEENGKNAMTIYNAFYHWARDATGETHNSRCIGGNVR